MKAVIYEKYGTPDVMELQEVAKPVAKANEVLVKVISASINPYDYIHVLGKPYLVRMTSGLFKPKQRVKVLGADVAGIIEAVGQKVTRFKTGDEVFGEGNYGSFAEFTCVNEELLTIKPSNITFEQAATVGMVGLTALQGLRKGNIQANQKVLINGASGGIGTFAVQIAKYFGAEVTGVCSTRNSKMVSSIGADHVIDYSQEDFANSDNQKYHATFDLVIDTFGNLRVEDLRGLLKPNGTCIVLGYTKASIMVGVMIKGLWVSQTSKQTITSITAQVLSKDLDFLSQLLESGKLVPVIDREYPLEKVPEALSYLRERHAQGKVVIKV